MAQSKKESTTTKKKTGTTTRKTSAKIKTATVEAPQNTDPVVPIRREFGAVLFLFMALFVGISYFKSEGSFILFFSNLIKGIIGWGYWLTAPIFLVVAVILAFHRGRPVALRSFCALMLPILFAALMNLILFDMPIGEFDLKVLAGELFEKGQQLQSGGLVGGLIAVGLQNTLSIYGAFPVLLVCIVFCSIYCMRFNFHKVADKVVAQATAKYDPSLYEDDDILNPVSSVVKPLAPSLKNGSGIERISRSAYEKDLPIGEDEELFHAESAGALPSAKTKRKQKETKTVEKYTPEPVLTPLPEDDAASLAGVQLINSIDSRTSPAIPESPDKNTAEQARVKKLSKADVEAEAQAISAEISSTEGESAYEFPPLSLLRKSTAVATDSRDEIITNKERLEGAIKSFGISAHIVGVTRGPTVTRYDVELDQGVKLARVTALAGDLALALGVVNVRIAPIPDKISTVGIEVPNKIVSTVFLRDIIDSPKFANAKSRLSFAIGKDIGGECIIGNIAKLPHMLIAGTTGSGKSVCMNSMILSILYKARPDEVRLIMIDPKMVELGVYNGIPHLYVPVVTDPKKAAGALQWSVVEMLKRYRMFSEIGVRDLENYNKHCLETGEATMPQVVIVIDELADLMLVASKEVEESICRVAQMGRAAGVHLVIATQRPSADVITGLMKANIPSRIAFAVSSAMESRIILDQGGAEKLVGMGDMLFSPVGCGKPIRIQGAFVSDEEREDVIQFIKESAGVTQQNGEIEEFMNKAVDDPKNNDSKGGGSEGLAGEYDEMLPKAIEAAMEMKSCSVSMIQRKVKLGYARAARVVDQMEELGVVGPYEGAKPRQVIIDREGWRALQVKLGLAVEDDDLALATEMNDDMDYDN